MKCVDECREGDRSRDRLQASRRHGDDEAANPAGKNLIQVPSDREDVPVAKKFDTRIERQEHFVQEDDKVGLEQRRDEARTARGNRELFFTTDFCHWAEFENLPARAPIEQF